MKRFVGVLGFLLALDLLTKVAAFLFLSPITTFSYPFGGVALFSMGPITFSLNLATNTGAAWGLFQNHPGYLFLLRIAILLFALFFLAKKEKHNFSFWLILTGAVGNAIDYLVYGYVIDFFHFTFWHKTFPIFNLADSYITLGAIALFLFRKPQKHPSSAP